MSQDGAFDIWPTVSNLSVALHSQDHTSLAIQRTSVPDDKVAKDSGLGQYVPRPFWRSKIAVQPEYLVKVC